MWIRWVVDLHHTAINFTSCDFVLILLVHRTVWIKHHAYLLPPQISWRMCLPADTQLIIYLRAFNNLWPAFTNLCNSFWILSSWRMQTPGSTSRFSCPPLNLVNNSRHMCERQLHFYKYFSVFHAFLKMFSKLWNKSWCFLTLLHDIMKYNICTGLRWRNWENWKFLFTNHWR